MHGMGDVASRVAGATDAASKEAVLNEFGRSHP
jgi:hypothetical protein